MHAAPWAPLGDEMIEKYIGRNVFIRYPDGAIYVAELVDCDARELLLGVAVWVASTGRLGSFLATGNADGAEWEPMPRGVVIPRAHAEVSPWAHAVPTVAQ